MTAWISAHKVASLLIALTLGFAVWAVAFSGDSDPLSGVETAPVEKTVVEQVVSETGVVEPAQAARLSFSASGPVAEISVVEGESVAAGQTLARLKTQALQARRQQTQAQLTQAQARLSELREGPRAEERAVSGANVDAAQTRVRSAEENLATVTQTQNELVRSAREDLYTSNLVPYLAGGAGEDDDYDFSPPTISGTYDSTETGQYKIDLYNSGAESGWSFRLSGLEQSRGRVATTQQQPLGMRGLFIEFPSNFVRGNDVEWVLEIPNTRSAQYAQLKNALQTAKENRTAAIKQAENALADARAGVEQAEAQSDLSTAGTRSQQIAAQEGAVAAARASVAEVDAAISDAILSAPFAGTVTDISIEPGESAGPSTPVVQLISDDPYEVVVAIPEVDTAQIDVGDRAEITLDAFEDRVFSGEVTAIAPTVKNVQGVRTLEVTVSLTDTGAVNVRTGLSADVDITAAETNGAVLAVPTRAIQQDADGRRFVYTKNAAGDGLARTYLEIGLRGSEGLVVVTDGLTEDAEIVTFIDQATRDRLEAAGNISD